MYAKAVSYRDVLELLLLLMVGWRGEGGVSGTSLLLT